MDEEFDIGLSRLSRNSRSLTSSPASMKRGGRRPSTITIDEIYNAGSSLSPIRSPPSPAPARDTPTLPRILSHSNTAPRLQINQADDLANLSMEAGKVLKLRRWIHGLAFVNFDSEYGPKITKTFPPLALSPTEAENIAFSSFPDAPQVELGSRMHSFRIRLKDPAEGNSARLDGWRPTSNDGFLYGYAYFTQCKDSSSKRGYQQNSLVILSHHPYPSLFYTLLSYLGQAFLTHGGPTLEVACHNIASWLDPMPGATIELGFLGFVFTVELPSSIDTPQPVGPVSIREYDPDITIMASLSPVHPPIVTIFESCLKDMWPIWECLVLGEPIMVYGTSAAIVSEAIWWMRDILRPIPLTGDFRPFFTIHDEDHTLLVNSRSPQHGVLLGVTNPIIERTCKHWPHLVSLAAPQRKETPATPAPRTPHTPWTPVDSMTGAGPPPGWKTKTHKRYISRDRSLLKRLEDACKGDERAKMEASRALRQHFSARTTALLVPLQRYINSLIPTPAETAMASAPSSNVALGVSRNKFNGSLATRAGTRPFASSDRVSTVPKFNASGVSSRPETPSSISSSSLGSPIISNPPEASLSSASSSISSSPVSSPIPPSATISSARLKSFNTSAFLSSLSSSQAVTLLPFKSAAKQKEFYERWLRSRTFGVWLAQQEEAVKKALEKVSPGAVGV